MNMRNVSPRTKIFVFLLITFAVSYIEEYIVVKSGDLRASFAIYSLMWTPGFVGLLLSLFFGHKLKDLGLKWGHWRYYLIAYIVPALTAILTFGLLLGTKIDSFEISPQLVSKKGGVDKALLSLLAYRPTLAMGMAFVYALGEEVGWRGFLQTQMLKTNFRYPFVVIGVIWSVWHWPLILFAKYATSDLPILSLTLFTIQTAALSVIAGWLRRASASVFVVAILHAAHNVWTQGIYPNFLKAGPLDQFFGGESGLFISAIYCGAAIFIYCRYLRNEILPVIDLPVPVRS